MAEPRLEWTWTYCPNCGLKLAAPPNKDDGRVTVCTWCGAVLPDQGPPMQCTRAALGVQHAERLRWVIENRAMVQKAKSGEHVVECLVWYPIEAGGRAMSRLIETGDWLGTIDQVRAGK